MRPLVLASGSTYRRLLFAKLGLTFTWASPNIDESQAANESAEQLVERLSIAKATALIHSHSQSLIIGSDQVAILDGQVIGKPHNHATATEQLRRASGKQVIFKTGLCLLNAETGIQQLAVEEYTVQFRTLTDAQINHYLCTEQPYDCAGSFKCEGLGIALFHQLSGNDPNTLIGLPLIRLIDMLKNEGIDPLLQASIAN